MTERAGETKIALPPGDEDLRALYREGRADDAPPPALDAAILAAGRDAVRTATPAARRKRPWWQVWLAPVSVAAVAVVGLTLSLHVAEDPEFDARERRPAAAAAPAAAPAASAERAEPAAQVQGTAPAASPAAIPERSAVADKTAAKAEAPRPPPAEAPRAFPAAPPANGASAVSGSTGMAESARARREDASRSKEAERGFAREEANDAARRPAAPPPAMSAPAPAPESPGRVVGQERRLEADRAAEAVSGKPARSMDAPPAPIRLAPELKKDAAPVDVLRDADRFNRLVAPSGEAAKRSRPEAAGGSGPAGAPAKALMAPTPSIADDARADIEADPARWIESIRRLRAAGREQEAAAELARFRSRHPDVRLPPDLLP
jgi:hypothetical protein